MEHLSSKCLEYGSIHISGASGVKVHLISVSGHKKVNSTIDNRVEGHYLENLPLGAAD